MTESPRSPSYKTCSPRSRPWSQAPRPALPLFSLTARVRAASFPWITRVMREQQGGHRETGQDPLMTDDGDDELALS